MSCSESLSDMTTSQFHPPGDARSPPHGSAARVGCEWAEGQRSSSRSARPSAAIRSSLMTGSDSTALEPEDLAVDVLDTPQAGPAALRGSALRTGAYVLASRSASPPPPCSSVTSVGRVRALHHRHRPGHTIVGGLSEGGVNAVALRTYTNHSGAERRPTMANLLGVRIGSFHCWCDWSRCLCRARRLWRTPSSAPFSRVSG